jgi:DNA-binding NarL/FixJ family response regulator
MRLIVVGTPGDRRDLREQLESSTPHVVGEFDSLAAAREAGIRADGVLLAQRRMPVADDEAMTPEALTAREIEVLELVAEGLPNKAIATRLGISDQTVKFHVASITGKLGAANRTDAVRRAVRSGLITL